MKASFFRHVIGGMAVATALAGVAFAALVWVFSPNTISVPWEFAAAALIESALLGAVIGGCVFLRSLLRGDHDEGQGGERDSVNDHPLETRQLAMPVDHPNDIATPGKPAIA